MSADSAFKTYIDMATLAVLAVTFLVGVVQAWWIRRTLEADAFMRIQERAREIGLSQTADLISAWSFDDYSNYENTVSPAQRQQVRDLIDFFNDLSHLANDKYINDYHPIALYFPTLRTCKQKLLPWWVNGIRQARKAAGVTDSDYLYNNFRYLCDYAEFWKESHWRHIGYRAYLRKEGVKVL
jgi:hypothetical protein